MKRLLSIVLAVAMIAALFPAVFAADTTEEFTGYNYVFTEAVIPEEGFARNNDGQIAQATLASMTLNTPISSLSAPWKLASVYRVNSTLSEDYFRLEGTRTGNAEPSFAIKIKVEQGGTYLPELTYSTNSHGGIVDIYLAKEGMSFDYGNVHTNTSNLDNSDSLTAQDCSHTYNIAYYFPKGYPEGTAGTYILKQNLDMWAASGTDETEDFDKKQLLLEGNTEYYLIVNIDGKSDKLKYTKEDETEAYLYPYFFLKSFSLTPVQDEELTNAFTVAETPANDYVKPTAIGVTADKTKVIDAEDNGNGTFNLTAPDMETKFLYWALGLTGNKRIVSFSGTLKNYVPAQEGRNYLIAVYQGDVDANKVEYYNQNGQLIPEANESTTVSMPGYGSTNKWVQYEDTNIWVADYEKTKDDREKVTVTVENGTGGGTVLYGSSVTCTAEAEDENGNPFKCWTKSNIYGATEAEPEIVSVDEEYTFKAWEDCTVTAVYADHHYTGNTMKIIIDTFATGSENGVMAEFIGLDNAVEKGIMFKATGATEATKIAMTTKGNQFTVIADGTGTYEGYAIVGNAADGYTQIIDGSYSK